MFYNIIMIMGGLININFFFRLGSAPWLAPGLAVALGVVLVLVGLVGWFWLVWLVGVVGRCGGDGFNEFTRREILCYTKYIL
jgi:hypothetical protein